MQEAIKDKTLAVQKQMMDEKTGEMIGHCQEAQQIKEDKDSDSDFNSDGDEGIL